MIYRFRARLIVRKLAMSMVGLSLLWTGAAVANSGGGEGGGDAAGPQYLPLESVLVNLDGKRHYLRADIQLLVDSGEHMEKMKAHMPAIRHSLIMLFSGRNPDQVSDVAEREKLRQSAKEEIKKVLEHQHADKGLEDVFFTDFMVQ
jgi:flagellar FliL protein